MRNRLPLVVVVAGLLASGSVVGCAEAGAPGQDPVGVKDPGASAYGDEVGSGAASGGATAGAAGDTSTTFLDLASVAFHDSSGREFLYQWLLIEGGEAYVARRCTIDEVGGPNWDACTAWSARRNVTDLQLGMNQIRAFGAYAYEDASDGVHTQWIAQTVVDASGHERFGRACPVEGDAIKFNGCGSWNRLHFSAAEMKRPYLPAMRDDSIVAFTDEQGAPHFVETVIHEDGHVAAERDCASPGGDPNLSPSQCAFSSHPVNLVQRHQAPVGDFLGHGGFTYHDAAVGLLYDEAYISSNGVSGYRRACPVGVNGVDWGRCGDSHEVVLDAARLGHGAL